MPSLICQTVALSEPPRGFFKTLIAGLYPRVSDSLVSGWSRLIHFFFFFSFFWPRHAARGILFTPQLRIEPVSPALEVQSLNCQGSPNNLLFLRSS